MKQNICVIIIINVILILLSCNNNIQTDRSLVGKKIEYFESYKDNLIYDTIFYLSKSKSLFEYQGDLFRFFPKLGNGDSVRVKEMCFNSNKNKLYVWFKLENGNWIVIDNILINKKVNF